jgi:TonB family protein
MKARRVTVTFSLAEARLGRSSRAGINTTSTDDLPYEFLVSGNPNRRYRLKKIDFLGLSDDEIGKIRTVFENRGMHVGDEFALHQLESLREGSNDHHLRTYFLRKGNEFSVAVAPAGFIAGKKEESPPIESETVPRGAELDGPIRVSAADQARKLISRVDPEYPGNSDWGYVQGVVRVVFTVGKDGRVISADTTAHRFLQDVAVNAVKQWKYSPTVLNGQAVEVLSEVYFDFFLPY